MKNDIEKKAPAMVDETLLSLKILAADATKKQNDKARYQMDYYDAYPEAIDFLTNNDMWYIFLTCTDKKTLLRAAALSKKTIYIDNPQEPDHVSMDTYANLLYKAGDKINAIVWEEQALNLAIARKDDRVIEEAEKNLRKMRHGRPTWDDDN